jgi:uncharacterized protein YgbK (DUF1537 family)
MLGCIADDYTGASDVATALSRAGRRTTLIFGAPGERPDGSPSDAVVVGLKIRTAPAAQAVGSALRVHDWLAAGGAERIYFKYCSTFDSTDAGNIGPVADALMTATGTELTVVCPAAPEHGRTVYRGYLFVGSRLLSETSMRDHPLTPMRDSSVTRTLARQTEAGVDLVPYDCVLRGAQSVSERLSQLRSSGVRYAVVDALSEEDLRTVARAVAGMRLVTGSAGLAAHLGRRGRSTTAQLDLPRGPTAILAGSCSAATLGQVELASRWLPAYRLDVRGAAGADELLAPCTDWIDRSLRAGPAVMVYSSAAAHERSADDAPLVEQVMAALARHLLARGVRRLVVAGGETAAAVVEAIDVHACTVGREEARGVPWLIPQDGRGLALLLKSGNFGDPQLFVRAAG